MYFVFEEGFQPGNHSRVCAIFKGPFPSGPDNISGELGSFVMSVESESRLQSASWSGPADLFAAFCSAALQFTRS